ncbi:hypothetical protein [Campylobacter concisus]|nr:hypothetical protein [Campylobacter concisus]
MKTIRLLYPDYLSGGLPIYHFWCKFAPAYLATKYKSTIDRGRYRAS